MATAIDVARLLCERIGKIDAYKLQKLTYYSQAWNLVINNEKLFDNKIEAWAAGPVCPDLYKVHRGSYFVDSEMLAAGDSAKVTERELRAIDFVIKNYGDLDGRQLSFLSHTEEPWIRARKRANAEEGTACNEEVTTDDMLEFYLRMAQNS
ncbi:MAG: DUF4065 domain-containing protein [Actinomycetota bacterium]|nr:DUF4065 domain-containing protein [Actinomycetota bacterium]